MPRFSWFVADWGVVTVGPFRLKGVLVNRGEELRARYRVLVHDGDADAAGVARAYDDYLKLTIFWRCHRHKPGTKPG